MKKQDTLSFNYQIDFSPGNTLKPENFRLHKETPTHAQPDSHLKYISDLLVGLTYTHLHKMSEKPSHSTELTWQKKLYQSLNPMFHLYKKSSDRLRDITSTPIHESPPNSQNIGVIESFEKKFSQKIITFFSQPQISLQKMTDLIEDLNQLEADLKKPLLFNFKLTFSESFVDLVLAFQTFLFQLRSMTAIHYNNFVEDHSQEGLMTDPLGDYLPSAEFIVNDAIIYWNFKKLARPYSTQTHIMKPEVPGSVNKLLIEPTEFLFKKYNHNAFYLIQNIPQGILSPLTPTGLEETLYLMTMDWLLGSPASLLFKIREELYGIKNSYDQIFWSDRELLSQFKAQKMIVQCSIGSQEVQFMAA